MPLNERSVITLLDQIEEAGLVEEIKLDHNHPTPSFNRPRLGYAIWRWGDLGQGEHAIRTLVYEDVDGKAVLLTLVAGKDNCLREVEAWRGDGNPVQSLGAAADMKVAD